VSGKSGQGRARNARSGNRRAQVAGTVGGVVFDDPVVVLDAQAMSLLAEPDSHRGKRELIAVLRAYEEAGYVAAISVVTIAEERRAGQAGQRLTWWQSQLPKVPVSEALAAEAGTLLDEADLDGHENVVDSIVVATAAFTTTERARVLSSDGNHIPALCTAATDRRGGRAVEFRRL
jgi:hypothetical protein